MGFDRTANADLRKRSLVTARAILGQNGNRTRLVLAILLCCVASMFPMLLISWPLSVLLDWETLLYENEALVVLLYMGEALLRALFFFFLVLPLYLGVFRMAVRMTREETTELYDVFYYFSDKALYWRGIKVLCASLWSLIPLYIFYSFYGVFYQPEPVWTVAIAFMLLLPHLVISAFSGGFALLFAMQETASVGDCMRTARRLSKGGRWSNFLLSLSFLWRLVLSLIPAGVPFFIHTLPICLLASANYTLRRAEAATDDR